MDADKSTLWALLWHSASALQLLPREQPLAASYALMRNATETLTRQYNLDRVLDAINPATQYIGFSYRVPGYGKASILAVVALTKGMTIVCEPRLDPEYS